MSQITDLTVAPFFPNVPQELLDALDPNVKQVLEPLIEQILVYQGQIGNSLDRPLTRREAYEAGIIDLVEDDGTQLSFSGTPADGSVTATPSTASSVSSSNITLAAPATASGLVTSATEEHVFLKWDAPDYIGHSETEIWRSASNDLGTATKIASVPLDTRAYADDLGSSGQTRYYWIRHVNSNALAGSYNAGTSGGTAGTTTASPSTTQGYLAIDGADIVHLYVVSAYIAALAVTNAKIANATIEGGKVAAATITADKYSELRQTFTYTYNDQIDSSVSLDMPFRIPSETTSIEDVRVSFQLQPFRAYSKSAESKEVGTHFHDLTVKDQTDTGDIIYWDADTKELCRIGGTGTITLSTADGHSHDITLSNRGSNSGLFAIAHDQSINALLRNKAAGTTSSWIVGGSGYFYTDEANGHRHRIDFDPDGSSPGLTKFISYDATHGMVDAQLVGDMTVDTGFGPSIHTHDLEFGIYTESNSPTLNLYADNGGGFGSSLSSYTTDQAEVDVTAQFTGTGTKKLRLTSTARCRVVVQIEAKVDITA